MRLRKDLLLLSIGILGLLLSAGLWISTYHLGFRTETELNRHAPTREVRHELIVSGGIISYCRHVYSDATTWSVDAPRTWLFRWDTPPTDTPRTLGFNHYVLTKPSAFGGTYTFTRWSFPICLPLLLSLIPLAFGIKLLRRKRLQERRGLCPKCLYDLRAHSPGDKCPECGTAIPIPASKLT